MLLTLVVVLSCLLAGQRAAPLREAAWWRQCDWFGLKKLRFSDWERRNRSSPIDGTGGRADTMMVLPFH